MLIIQRPRVEEVGEEVANRQVFTIGPLEPGFGHSVGNALRRVLLSSVPGAAITQVRFDDALHEFTTIGGVKEDVIDIILNLKDIVLRCYSPDPVTIRLDVKGPASVHAGDFMLSSEVEIVNPDLYIATVSDKGRLALDVVVEQGRGYVSAERNKRTNTIGIIPIDAIFSPIRNANYVVEPVRVGQATDYDQIVVDVETDGSITPREALASAAGTLTGIFELVSELVADASRLVVADEAAIEERSPDFDLPIEELDLTERPRNCLKRAQINTIGDLVERTADDLLAITNFGQKSLDEVAEKLALRNMSLRSES
ncbi:MULTISPECIES: DNA-directed RNA polymerase subunit alpha [Ferrimicrobium]|jgi:DNA-directed RNA polymerase subunit alpha|uniref:DNA-directed RNA polymerase subunit alpha n=1 Tax=Ferrimicrobium acidiphilum TaxID=121039 RepID=A0ABV3Y1U5_9ACTN|nr:DNA-directed RNA polymerase subunit alpha [Ferrimicrobium sp.]MCL5972913.1 DNA-directed RNA polymerase subunit alpha [Actinomycetota bacterium]